MTKSQVFEIIISGIHSESPATVLINVPPSRMDIPESVLEFIAVTSVIDTTNIKAGKIFGHADAEMVVHVLLAEEAVAAVVVALRVDVLALLDDVVAVVGGRRGRGPHCEEGGGGGGAARDAERAREEGADAGGRGGLVCKRDGDGGDEGLGGHGG